MGRVLAIGPDVNDVVPDDRIMFGKYAGTDITLNDRRVTVIREGDVYATVEEVEQEGR